MTSPTSSERWTDGLQFSSLLWSPPRDPQQHKVLNHNKASDVSSMNRCWLSFSLGSSRSLCGILWSVHIRAIPWWYCWGTCSCVYVALWVVVMIYILMYKYLCISWSVISIHQLRSGFWMMCWVCVWASLSNTLWSTLLCFECLYLILCLVDENNSYVCTPSSWAWSCCHPSDYLMSHRWHSSVQQGSSSLRLFHFFSFPK